MKKIYKPTSDYAFFHEPYLDLVPDDGDLLQHLRDIQTETADLIAGLTEEQLNYSYDEGKWTIKDILVHLSDCERIFIYRATRCARGDKTDLPGFDEALFAGNANANKREINDIMKELEAFRVASIVFIDTLDEDALSRTGTANGYPISTRLIANHIYGHHRHHLNIIKQQYLQ